MAGGINEEIATMVKRSNQAFANRCVYWPTKEIDKLKEIILTERNYPSFFRFIVSVSSLHRRFREKIWRLRHHK